MKSLRLLLVIVLLSFATTSCVELFDKSKFTTAPPNVLSQKPPAFTNPIPQLAFWAYIHKHDLLALVLLLTTWFFYRRYRSARRRILNLDKDEECLLGVAFNALSDLRRHRKARLNSKVLPLTRNP